MKATVVVSCYNQKNYIRECLESILNQSVDFEFDILVSDDCSTDGTAAILLEYKPLYPEKMTVITREKNVGPALNYIEAHKAALGDVIFHIDGDDVMLPGKLQKQYNLFKMDESVNLVFHRAVYFSDCGTYMSESGTPPPSSNGTMYFDASDIALWGSITVHSAYAYRRTSRKEWPENEFMEWLFAMDSLLPTGKGVYIDEVLVKYRCNLTGGAYLSSKAGRIKAYNIYFNNLFYIFDKFPYLRSALYSNCLVTALAMFKSGCGISKKIPYFILRNWYLFNIFKFKKTIAMRLAIAPEKKIR